jgi:hypothetical protein
VIGARQLCVDAVLTSRSDFHGRNVTLVPSILLSWGGEETRQLNTFLCKKTFIDEFGLGIECEIKDAGLGCEDTDLLRLNVSRPTD